MFRPFRARVSVWVLLTQAFSLGFVISPLWGSRAHTLSPAERENRLRAEARKNCVFLLRGGEGGPRRAFSPAVAGRMRGHFPSGPADNIEIPSSSSTLPPINEAGECRGHCEGAKDGKQGSGLSLSTRHFPLVTCHCLLRVRLLVCVALDTIPMQFLEPQRSDDSVPEGR